MFKCPNCNKDLLNDNIRKCYHCYYDISDEEFHEQTRSENPKRSVGDTNKLHKFVKLRMISDVFNIVVFSLFILLLFCTRYSFILNDCLLIIFTVFLATMIVGNIVFIVLGAERCPFCGLHIGMGRFGSAGRYCPHCGKEITL